MNVVDGLRWLLHLPGRIAAMPISQVKAHYPPHLAAVIAEFQALFPVQRLGVYDGYDWNRVGFAASLAKGDRVLDVGAGNGALLNVLMDSGRHTRVSGVDVRRNSMQRLRKGIEFKLMDITQLTFADREFDTVVCMEVIEHLPPEIVDQALRQLRRVAGQRLLITVPYRERHPLFHHDRPMGHKQSFDDEKLARLFPSGIGVLLPRSRVDWLLIVEEPETPQQSFRILDMQAFSDALHTQPAVRQGLRRTFELVRRRFPVREWLRPVIKPFRRVLGLAPRDATPGGAKS